MAVAAMALGLAGPDPARAATVVLPRAGQVGVGLQGGYGTLLKSGELGRDFGNGPTFAVRLRYRMRYERAVGLSFENQRFDIRAFEAAQPGTAPPLPGRTHANLILSGFEFYQMFATRTRTPKMVMVGAGFAQPSARTLNKETVFISDGGYLSAGFGFERFFFRSWALDVSARYVSAFLPDGRTHDLQAAAGLIFYVSY
jgi:hypothetical protein